MNDIELHLNILSSFQTVQWPDHISNGGTAVTKTSGADTAEITETVATFRDPKFYMKGTELHTSRKPADLSDFWAAHRARLVGVGAVGRCASHRARGDSDNAKLIDDAT